jgi:hypothetical protein
LLPSLPTDANLQRIGASRRWRVLQRVQVQVDVDFSNSLIEAFWRSAKHTRLSQNAFAILAFCGCFGWKASTTTRAGDSLSEVFDCDERSATTNGTVGQKRYIHVSIVNVFNSLCSRIGSSDFGTESKRFAKRAASAVVGFFQHPICINSASARSVIVAIDRFLSRFACSFHRQDWYGQGVLQKTSHG